MLKPKKLATKPTISKTRKLIFRANFSFFIKIVKSSQKYRKQMALKSIKVRAANFTDRLAKLKLKVFCSLYTSYISKNKQNLIKQCKGTLHYWKTLVKLQRVQKTPLPRDKLLMLKRCLRNVRVKEVQRFRLVYIISFFKLMTYRRDQSFWQTKSPHGIVHKIIERSQLKMLFAYFRLKENASKSVISEQHQEIEVIESKLSDIIIYEQGFRNKVLLYQKNISKLIN